MPWLDFETVRPVWEKLCCWKMTVRVRLHHRWTFAVECASQLLASHRSQCSNVTFLPRLGPVSGEPGFFILKSLGIVVIDVRFVAKSGYPSLRVPCPLSANSGHWPAVGLKKNHEARVVRDCRVCARGLRPSFPDAVRRSATAARIVSAIGLNANQCGKERTSAGAPSSWTCSLRRASARVERPSQTR
jgi:hypothetical protein